MNIDIDDFQAACIDEYSLRNGIPMEECVAEALDDWIRTVASVSQIEKSNVIMFPGKDSERMSG